MKFKQLIKLYETKQKGPPYLYVSTFGTKRWYKDRENTTLHRTEKDPETGLTLPAVEYEDGDKFWYKDDQQHRLDGPAVEYKTGDKFWYINDIQLSPKEIEQLKQKIALDKQIASDQDNAIGGLWSTL